MNTKDHVVSGNVSTERALDLALEALESYKSFIEDAHIIEGQWHWIDGAYQAITAIKQARSAPVQSAERGEPVAWAVSGKITDWSKDFSAYQTKHYTRPVYTLPGGRQSEDCLTAAQRQWVGLTDEDISAAYEQMPDYEMYDEFARAIEAKLKEKNT
jgi:hypothetical protein